MKSRHIATVALFAFGLTGCIESEEEITARKAQFDGRLLSAVVSKIGAPQSQSNTQAVWDYKNTSTTRVPIQSLENGVFVTKGYRTQTTILTCNYVATLENGRVINSRYTGNSCRRYAPDLG